MDLANELERSTRFDRLLHVESCESTQVLAQEESAQLGDTGCAVYWADHQSKGRGREGRSWHDSPGQDIAVTFRVADPKLHSPTHLAAAIPVAVIESVADVSEIASHVRIKWPNDLMVRGRKLAGILIDTQPSNAYLIGVGINVNRSSFPGELREQSTSLALLTGREFERELRVLRLAQAIDRILGLLGRNETTELAGAFAAHLGLLGRRVAVSTGDVSAQTGTLTDINLDRIVLDGRVELRLAHLRRLTAL